MLAVLEVWSIHSSHAAKYCYFSQKAIPRWCQHLTCDIPAGGGFLVPLFNLVLGLSEALSGSSNQLAQADTSKYLH